MSAPATIIPAWREAPWHAATRVVLDGAEGCWDHPALAAAATALAGRLANEGLRINQVVLAPVAPALGLVLLQYALAQLGAALLPVRTDLTGVERAALVATTGAEWYWEPGSIPAVPIRDQCPPGRLRPTGTPTGTPTATRVQGSNDLALLVQTSGSSGTPRLAMLTQRQVLVSCDLINARLGLGPGDAWLAVLPRQHIGGLAITHRCALAGATLVLQEQFDAARVAAALTRHRITHLSLIPALLDRLVAAAIAVPPALRVVLLGGQALSPTLSRRAAAAGWPVYLGYGMTETCSQVAGAWLDANGRLPDLLPLPGVELAGTTGCAETPTGQTTGLRIRGPMVMAGYANRMRQAGVGLLPGGWLQTSDLACLTTGGRMRVLGRADGVLISGGVKIVPEILETQLAMAPNIGEVALTAIPDPAWGHRLVLLYTGPISPADLTDWCRTHLTSGERPRLLLTCPTLPLLASGKPDRRAIATLASKLASPSAVR